MGLLGLGKMIFLNVFFFIDKVSVGIIKVNEMEIMFMKEKQFVEFRKWYFGFIFQDYNLLDMLIVKENIFLLLFIMKMFKKEVDL